MRPAARSRRPRPGDSPYLKTGADTIFKFTSEIAEDGAQIGNDDKSVDVAKVKNLKYGASAILHVVSKITEIKVSPDNPTLKTVIMETKTALEEMLPSADDIGHQGLVPLKP